MTDYNDGGHAFPWGSDGFIAGGLSIRDWFAGQAPEPSPEYMDQQYRLDRARNPHNDSHKPQQRDTLTIKAQYRYAYADAMLSARQGGAA